MKCLLPLPWLQNGCSVSMGFNSNSCLLSSVLQRERLDEILFKQRNPNGILEKPSQHSQTPVQNKLEAWDSVDSIKVWVIQSSEDSSIPSGKGDVGMSTHTIEIRSSGLHVTFLQAQAHPLPIALHNLASLWTGKWWIIYAEIYLFWSYESQKCHCTNKSSVGHPAKCKTLTTGLNQCSHQSRNLVTSTSKGTGFLITRMASSPWRSFAGWPLLQ